MWFLFSRFSILWVGLFPFKKCPFTQIHLPYRSVIYKMVYKTQIHSDIGISYWFIDYKNYRCMVHQARVMWFWSSKGVKHSSLKKTHICHQYAIPIFFCRIQPLNCFHFILIKKNLFLYSKVVTFPPKWNYTWLSSTLYGIRSGELSNWFGWNIRPSTEI